jgi:hypothetical protein
LEVKRKVSFMEIARIKNATRVIGKSQGYLGLPIRDEIINEATNGLSHSMTTAWIPTPKELEKLNQGASVHVTILGVNHPPMIVTVGEPPE